MKVVGNCQLAQHADQAVENVFELGTVHALTIGMTAQQQLLENIPRVSEYSQRFPL